MLPYQYTIISNLIASDIVYIDLCEYAFLLKDYSLDRNVCQQFGLQFDTLGGMEDQLRPSLFLDHFYVDDFTPDFFTTSSGFSGTGKTRVNQRKIQFLFLEFFHLMAP